MLEKYKNKVNEIMGLTTPENQARISELLTDLTDDFQTVLTNSETSENKVKELTANNETLRAVNAKLFLKVGTTEKGETKPSPDGAGEVDNEIPDISFDSLFDEKGGLK